MFIKKYVVVVITILNNLCFKVSGYDIEHLL